MYNQNNKFFFNNARNCLRIFLRSAGVHEMFVPFELCSVVFKAARAENVRLKFYHIDENFMPVTEFPQNTFILYPNYFGICDENAQELAQKYPNLIYDATQSFFAEPLGIATIYSARKFFHVADGGILVTDLKVPQEFPKEYDEEDFSTDPLDFDYENFLRNELKFNNSDEIKLISDKSRLKLSQIDLEKEKGERTENFWRLHEQFGAVNELKIPPNVTAPMVYPLKVSNAQIKNDNGIFILQYKYMKNIIPLPLINYSYL
ncbi:MAG: hypothetical protein NC390_02595 [Fusobacterium sp.]|nr:hypothetical protein [Fusobacterium sp.]